ncbi:MAG: radical SAM protein [Oceanidesulfovibrio sp.]
MTFTAAHIPSRIKLPVSALCNVQCRFCDRNLDCAFTAPDGVASETLSPMEAAGYIDAVLKFVETPVEVCLSGPGEPLARPEETFAAARLVVERHPDAGISVATNGLALPGYAQDLAKAGVHIVRLAVADTDPLRLGGLVAFIRTGKRSLRGDEAVRVLLAQQQKGVAEAKRNGLRVVAVVPVAPEINKDHMAGIARTLESWGVDSIELVPFVPREKSGLGKARPATAEDMDAALGAVQTVMPNAELGDMGGDGVSLLGEEEAAILLRRIKLATQAETVTDRPMPDLERPHVAVATSDGESVDVHLGHAEKLLVYGNDNGLVTLREARQTPPRGGGVNRWNALADLLSDVKILIAAGAGDNPRAILAEHGVDVRVYDDAPLQGAVLHAFGIKPKGRGRKGQ